ncbi:MAG: metallophosphoesterase family protein [Thermoleophilia bacterium]
MGAARTTRIGVVADTHVGEFLDALPDGVLEALEGCDLILHAGDLSVPAVLDDLEAVAPVVAVRGDHDRLGGLALPETAVVTAGGTRIGLTHGRQVWAKDASVIVAGLAAGRNIRYRAGLARRLVKRMGPVDAIVHGHWHEPVEQRVGGVLVYSPGAVCPWGSLEGGRPPRPGRAGVADRAVRRFRRQLGPDAMRPSVGVLEVGSGGIRPVTIPLPSR